MSEVTDDERRMAACLNCNPTEPETWPMGLIRRLIRIKTVYGQQRLYIELDKLRRR